MTGAGVSNEVRLRISNRFGGRCAYCRSPLFLFPGSEHIEHIRPRTAQGASVEENLCLACCRCNLRKGTRTSGVDPATKRMVTLFHPRQQNWDDHFRWTKTGTRLIGRSATGRATIMLLRLNDVDFVTARRSWVKAAWHPPNEHPTEEQT